MTPTPFPTTAFVEAAVRIGQQLCRSAFWDREGRLCNWMGRSEAEAGADRLGGFVTPTATALGPDLYGGSSGVALFLARLFAVTGEEEDRRAALGAMARSIRQVDREPDRAPLSVFNGALGVAVAALRVADLTGSAALAASADALLDRLAEAADLPHLLDLAGGSAGAIPVLLTLGQRRPLWSDRAVALGEELCRTAIRDGPIRTWAPVAMTGPGNGPTCLTGLAHGASGLALALLELHAATGRPDFLEAASGAFAYEDSHFVAGEGNWADLRPHARPGSCALAWCHGAPGIALARLRAAALDPAHREAHAATARIAIGTTLRGIEKILESPRADATLCHGLSGLADIVLVASRAFEDDTYRRRAVEIGQTLVERHAATGDWPSGLLSGGPSPSLMLGTAGIGYTFLRLHDPDRVPSLLTIQF